SVCIDEGVTAARTLDLISSLVDKSLVMKEDTTGRASYRLHETMREDAGLKLREAGEQVQLELRCADYYVAKCQGSVGDARYHLVEWLDWIGLEIDHIRAILRRWVAQADSPRGVVLAASLIYFWITRATTEGSRWLDELLAGSGNPAVDAWVYFIRGFLAVLQGDLQAARPALERAIAAARETEQLLALSNSL